MASGRRSPRLPLSLPARNSTNTCKFASPRKGPFLYDGLMKSPSHVFPLIFACAACVSTPEPASSPDGLALPADDADAAPAFVDPELLKKPVTSVAEWSALPAEVRQEIVDSAFAQQPSMAKTALQPVAKIADAKQKAFVETMLQFMKTNSDLKIIDDQHAIIGGVETSAAVLQLKDGTILGGELAFAQAGCTMPDDSTPTFKTAAEAQAAGCDGAAVLWTAHGTFNFDGAPFEYSDYMEQAGY